MRGAGSERERAPEGLLVIEGAVKSFGGVTAVNDVSLRVEDGEVLGVIGPNGAGKSTLLKLVSGELTPDRGRIWLDGHRIDGLPNNRVARLGIGLAYQIPQPFHKLTVRQNVEVAALARGGGRSGRVDEVLGLSGLAGRADRPAGSLPLLDLKRLELARALALEPRLLLLDEVGAGLVRAELEEMIELVRRIHESGVTVVVVEHVELVIRALASRVVVMDWGRVITEGTPEAVSADQRVRELYLGHRPEDTAPVAKALAPPPPGREPLLELRGVDAGYGGALALRGIELELAEGEVVAVLGANGAGKTTLANVVSGARAARAGLISFGGAEITRLRAHERVELGIALCHEGRRLFPELSVGENLAVGAYSRRARQQAAASRERVLEIFPLLGDLLGQRAGTLSGGQQQMVAIGRALMAAPRLLILDEASIGLAPVVVEQLFAAVAAINEAGISVLVIEQHVHHSLALADRVYVLDHGSVSFSGTPA
ncbi:MAG: ATP-binding cassette domain-containing protein, partial [Thermoleophilia bacterium]|nr:ATP-binding cassette domain-containing protein [Thermoleophilia bacterium]